MALRSDRSDVEFLFGTDSNGEPVKHRLRLGSLQICDLERLLDAPMHVALSPGKMGIKALLTAMYVGMKKFEPDLEFEDVTTTFDAEASPAKFAYYSQKIFEAMSAAMPQLAVVKKGEKADALPLSPEPAQDAHATLTS